MNYHQQKTTHEQKMGEVFQDIKNKNFIEKNKYYVVEKTTEKNGIVEKKSQWVKIDGFKRHDHNNLILYEFHYGVFGYHEGFTQRKNIRKLTLQEEEYINKNMFFDLPNDFYISIPK